MVAQNNSDSAQVKKTSLPKIFILLLPLLIILLAVGVAFWLMETGPKAGKRKKERNAVLVEVLPVTITTEQVRLAASGTVMAAREVEIKPQVSGAIVEIHQNMIPGGKLRKGATLFVIDPADYQLALRQQENVVARAAAELQLESGNQILAQKEYELLGDQVSDEEMQLMLRKPQLQSLQAALDSARAAKEMAELNLKRTRIVAPFNGIVASRQVNIGSRVTSGSSLTTLVDSDSYWIEVTIPVEQLHWIDIPQDGRTIGSTVHISMRGVEGNRLGHVLRLLPGLEEQGRMARLLVEVADPLSLKAEHASLPPLLIGSWVQVRIDGRELPGVVALDRAWLRDGERVWLRDSAGNLEIRAVKPVFFDRDRVFIENGLTQGEELIISRLPAPVAGMALRTKDGQENGASAVTPDGAGRVGGSGGPTSNEKKQESR